MLTSQTKMQSANSFIISQVQECLAVALTGDNMHITSLVGLIGIM